MYLGLYDSITVSLGQFQLVSKEIYPYLIKEEGIVLNYSGYSETLLKGKRIETLEFDEMFIYIKELSAWIDYLNEVVCVINKLSLRYENRELYLLSFVDTKRENKKINRLLEENDKNKKLVDNYYTQLYNQIRLLHLILETCNHKFKEDAQKYNR